MNADPDDAEDAQHRQGDIQGIKKAPHEVYLMGAVSDKRLVLTGRGRESVAARRRSGIKKAPSMV